MIRSSSSSVFFSVSSVDVAPPLDTNSSKVSAPSCPFAAPLGLGTADLGLMGLSVSNGSGSAAMVVGVWVGVDSSIHRRQRRGGSLARLNVNFISGDLGGSTIGLMLDFLGKTGSSMGDVTQERGSILFYFLCHENLPFLFGDGGKSFHRVEGHSRQRFDPEDAEL